MTLKAAILATIDAEPEKVVHGRTALHKKLYFVSVLTGEDFGFSPYYYGPYSTLVTDEVGALVEAGFVRETVDFLGIIDRFGEKRRYSYSLADDALAPLARANGELDRYRAALVRINALPAARRLDLLAVASKVHFIVAHGGPASEADIRARASELGWQMDADAVHQVNAFLTTLGLPAGGRPPVGAPD